MNRKDPSAMARLRCREIMTKSVSTASPGTTLRDVASIMAAGDVGSVPVIDGGNLVGLITDRDIVIRAVAAGKPPETLAADVMTTEIFSVRPDDFVFEAIRLMGDKQIRRIPVVSESGELAGIIAMADIALETEDSREVAEMLEEISSGEGFWQRRAD